MPDPNGSFPPPHTAGLSRPSPGGAVSFDLLWRKSEEEKRIMELMQVIINGILIGGVYALLAVGLTLVFGIMDIVNFAQSEFLMLGMFFAYIASKFFGLDPILSSFAVFAAVFLIGAFVQRFFIQQVLDAAMVTQILLTVGISI